VLGVKAILVLGHTNYGAVKAAATATKPVPGQISILYQYIQPAIAGANGDLTAASRLNASAQMSVLSASPVLDDLLKQNKLRMRAAIYDVGNGKVTMIDA
jgi:carbonic anhydrase